MHKPSISNLVYKTLFPRPRQGDPTTFSAHINRNLVPEVRIETANFYGALNCIEAQYPGLDYSHAPHRRRLSRFPWHKKLFRVFDELCLTRNEILGLCQWEGTRSAKEKYETDVGRLIRDTTMDDIAPAAPSRRPVAHMNPDLRGWRAAARLTPGDHPLVEDVDEVEANQESDGDIEILSTSHGNSLNAHLRSAAEARVRGEGGVVPNELWEQWLKEAMERNELGVDGMLEAIRQGRPFAISPSHIIDATVHPPVLSLANTVSETRSGAPTAASAMNDTQIAIANVWNLGNQIVRNVNAGNAALVAPAPAAAAAAAVAAATTTASAQPAGEVR
ncbi:hypothetical protein GJ744_000864 [Endocarpon pusillum]|uniref:Uncharacterized protein n=1 Tax=Endocarpon pusillum TaxID=364733 RepID=A0A8H7ANY9_9EURO|nr:hypothetical protein GJ744_000864 [Endocarpon pusillum]